MAEENDTPRDFRLAIAVLALVFNAGIIVALMFYGKADNSLHASALAWSYATSLGVLAGLGFSAVASLLPAFTKK